MKKSKEIPSPEIIAEMDLHFEYEEVPINNPGVSTIKEYCPEFSKEFQYWNTNHEIKMKEGLGFFENFFDWYEISQTPLYKALNEED